MDICASSAMAQGATVNVYFTQASEDGTIAAWNRVFFPEPAHSRQPAERQPTVFTTSFDWETDQKGNFFYETLGDITNPATFISIMTLQLQQLAVLGINVFAASGCPQSAGGNAMASCVEFVANNPGSFKEA